MKPTLRFYRREDYPLLCAWSDAHGVLPPPQGALPRLGAVALDENETPLAMAWLYMDNSVGVALLAWTTTAPRLAPQTAVRAISALSDCLCRQGAHSGYRWIMAFAQAGLARLLMREGFFINHKNTQQLFKRN